MQLDKKTGKVRKPNLPENFIILNERPEGMDFKVYKQKLREQNKILKMYLGTYGIINKNKSNKYLPVTEEKRRFINNCSFMEHNRASRKFR